MPLRPLPKRLVHLICLEGTDAWQLPVAGEVEKRHGEDMTRSAHRAAHTAAHMAAHTARAAIVALGALAAVAAFQAPADAATPAQRFKTSDRDRSGTLNRAEFRTLINLLARDGMPIAKRVRFWNVYGLAFRITDANGDGQLSRSELIRSERQNRNRKRP